MQTTARSAALLVFLYAILLLIGGIIGHYKAASLASLICGSAFGLLMLLCSWGMFKGKRTAQYAALVLTFILDGFFTYRFVKTQTFMPAGLMSLLSLIVLLILALSIRHAPKRR